jgi:5-amino-6-(5-phosphoribosylamino)uracil reductase
MSVDGHIADGSRSPHRIGSRADRQHLDRRLADCDAVLMGASTLRAIGYALQIRDQDLLAKRPERFGSRQPVQVIASSSGKLSDEMPFFTEPVSRWLVTLPSNAAAWQDRAGFDRIFTGGNDEVDWREVMGRFAEAGVERICLAGGGDLVASILDQGLVDDIWMTICPVLVGGRGAPTPVDGPDRPLGHLPPVSLVTAEQIDEELFLHYRVG